MTTKARKPAAAAPAPAVPELVLVDPKTLIIGANVRIDPRVDKDFIASIKERGVLEPIVAYRDGAGRLVVLRGQRRTLAATEVKAPFVPVIVVPCPDWADRVTDQVVENDQRAALAVADRVGAYEQLAALGLTAEQISKRTSTPRDLVAAGLAVAKSEHARTAAQLHPLTLLQAAAIAEFEGDEKAVATLVASAEQGHGFDHNAQALRDKKEQDQVAAAAAAELTAAGVTVVDSTVLGYQKPAKRLAYLPGSPSPEFHASCPGHAAFVMADWTYDPDDDPDVEEADVDTGRYESRIEYVCTDPVGQGHVSATGGPAAGEKSEAARAAEAAERRDVIDSNKAWDSATKVRRTWLRTFMARKTPPATASMFVAASLGWCDHALVSARENGNKLAHELLGLGDVPGYSQRGAAIAKALTTGNRAQMIGLALVLAAYEDAMVRDRWRVVEPATVRYLRYLEELGYELSTVELRACGAKPKSTKAGRRPAGGAS